MESQTNLLVRWWFLWFLLSLLEFLSTGIFLVMYQLQHTTAYVPLVGTSLASMNMLLWGVSGAVASRHVRRAAGFVAMAAMGFFRLFPEILVRFDRGLGTSIGQIFPAGFLVIAIWAITIASGALAGYVVQLRDVKAASVSSS